MVKSMTGYGSDTFRLNGTVITVEIRSVNSRYLDIIPKIPRSLQEKEFTLKKLLQTYFNRGRIELYITISGEPLKSRKMLVDWKLLEQYMEQLDEIKGRFHMKEDVPLSVIANKEELFMVQEEDNTDHSFDELLVDSVKRACEKVVHTRLSEGEFLKKDMVSRLDKVLHYLTNIDNNHEEINLHYRKRIEERIKRHIDHSMGLDQHHLIQEIALLAEKGDIQEEITRLQSHLEHFNMVIKETTEIGRKLDFIVQEMHREANTIGSKSIDAVLSENIVLMKSELEKIKEQIQNIE